jgi:hypothetical protein
VNAEGGALPENGPGGVDDARRVDEVAAGEIPGQRAGEAERDERAVREAVASAEPDQGRARTAAPRRPLLGLGGAGQH